MKIEIVKMITNPITGRSEAIDAHGRLYEKRKNTEWCRFMTFCTRHENREYFDERVRFGTLYTGRIFIEVPWQ